MSNDQRAVNEHDTEKGDENQDRGNWSRHVDFVLSCVGYAVGLGNIWRFPYLAYRNGGGAFLVPYVIMLIITGLPMFYFEMSLGQFANLGPITVWRLSPMFKGIGWGMVIISALVCIYYNVVIGWAIYYLVVSFTNKLPWDSCLNSFNDVRCRQRNRVVANQTNVPGNNRNNSFPLDCTKNLTTNCTMYQTPAEQYWERIVLGVVNPVTGKQRYLNDGIGLPQWHLSLTLLASWILVFLCLIKGVKSSGKVVYVTAIFPYVVLVPLLINGLLLEGSGVGLGLYFKPNWRKLMEAKVWGDAATQIFYSLGVAFGGLLTMASYNKFKNNCYRDSMIVAIINCSTSVFAGIVIFSVIGSMSYKTGIPVEKVATSGPGLAFVAYAEGLASMPGAPFWSILFFIMILTLGLDSQFGMMETVISGLSDEFPVLKKNLRTKTLFAGSLCIAMFLLGLPMVCKGGIYLFTLVDWYSASFSLMVIALMETVVVMYVYGAQNFLKDVRMMLGFLPAPYWVGCWMVVSPVAIVSIIVFSCIQYVRVYYGAYKFPTLYEVLGWLMVCSSIIPIPITIILETCKRNMSLRRAAAPSKKWGPCVEKFWLEDPRYKEKLEMKQASRNRQLGVDGYGNEAYTKTMDDISRM